MRAVCVMERLAENCQIDRAVGDGRLFKVTQSILKIRESVIFGQLGSNFDHALRNIDCDDLSSAFSEKLGKRSFACAQVCNINCGNQGNQEVRQCLPRSARTKASPEFPRELIKVFACTVPSFGYDMF